MAKSMVYKSGQGQGGIEFNMTPMIDVTFQLIIFFIIAGQLKSQELAQLDLHRPFESQAIEMEKAQQDISHVVVNVLSLHGTEEPKDIDPTEIGKARCYKISGKEIELGNVDRVVEILRDRRLRAGENEFFLEIRADNRVNYGYVLPIMEAAAEAQIPMMNITALLKTGKVEK